MSVRHRQVAVSPRRWLLLPIQIKVRELDGNALLAFEAAERGWGVILASKNIRTDISSLPRGLLIEKNLAPGTSAKLREVKTKGRRLVAWCEEGLIYQNAKHYVTNKFELDAYQMVDRFFAWGSNQHQDLSISMSAGDANKLVTSGNPRFDIHRREIRRIVRDRVARIRDTHGPFILINTKFSSYNGARGLVPTLENLKKLGRVLDEEHEARLLQLGKYQGVICQHFLDAIKQLSLEFPQLRIIVRPHPSEYPGLWQTNTSQLKNVKVVSDGNIVDWILASEVCIHNNCTSAVEAFLLGKKAISFRPVSDERFDFFLPSALSNSEAFSSVELLSQVRSCLNNEEGDLEVPASKIDIARRYVANLDGESACARILDALDTIDLPEESLSFSRSLLEEIAILSRRKFRSIKNKRQGGLAAERQRRLEARINLINSSELDEFLNAARRELNKFNTVKVAELDKGVFCLFRE